MLGPLLVNHDCATQVLPPSEVASTSSAFTLDEEAAVTSWQCSGSPQASPAMVVIGPTVLGIPPTWIVTVEGSDIGRQLSPLSTDL